MCDCLEAFEKNFLEKYPTWKGKSVKDVSLPSGFNIEKGKTVYCLPIYIEVGQKKPKEAYLIMSYCPICGKMMEE